MEILPDLSPEITTFLQYLLGTLLVAFCLLLAATPVMTTKFLHWGTVVTTGLAGGEILWQNIADDSARGWAVGLFALSVAFLIASAHDLGTAVIRKQITINKKYGRRYDDV